MDRKALNVAVCAILTMLLEMDGHWSPRTPIYLALGDMGKFEFVENVLVAGKLVESTSETMTLTPLGEEFANKINALVRK